MVWVQFAVCLAIIIAAGSKLVKYGDLIAEKTGLGRVWIGIVLLATVTSLPELATGISSVTFIGEPDLTIGNLFGAGLVNLAIIAVIDLLHRRGPVLHYLGTGIVLSTVLSLMLIATAAISIFLSQNLLTVALFGRVGVYSVVLFCLYLLAQYMIFRFESTKKEEAQLTKSEDVQEAKNEEAEETKSDEAQEKEIGREVSLRRVITYFTVAAVAVAGAGTWLAYIGDQLSVITGLSTSFVGTLFLAIATTAPEIVVSISAARLGSLHMAIGNVVGSNLFNIGVIIFVDDLFYSAGPILQGVRMEHIITALFTILMSSIVITGIIFRPKLWLRLWVGIDTVSLAVLYLGAMATLYLLSKPA